MSPASRDLSGQRQRVGVIALVAMAVVGWGLLSAVALPSWTKLRELHQQSQVARKKLVKLQRLAGRKPAIEQRYAADAAYIAVEPSADVKRTFLDELEQLTQGPDLQLTLKSRPPVEENGVTRIPVEVEVDATQDSLMQFLDRLLAWPRLVEIDRLRIGMGPSKELPLRGELLVNRVVLAAGDDSKAGH